MKRKFTPFKLKDKEINFCIIENNNKEYFVVALHNNKQIGYCNFYLENGTCKLSRIVILQKEFLGYGIGNIMFKAMENVAFDNNVKYLSAIFIPRGYPNSWDLTSKFYKNQGMTTFGADYDYIEREEISKYISSPQKEYSLPVIADNKLYDKISHYNYETNDIFSSNRNTESSELQL